MDFCERSRSCRWTSDARAVAVDAVVENRGVDAAVPVDLPATTHRLVSKAASDTGRSGSCELRISFPVQRSAVES
jgi:hypothetical protein